MAKVPSINFGGNCFEYSKNMNSLNKDTCSVITERAGQIPHHWMFAGFIDRFTTVMREPMYALGNALSDIIYAPKEDRSAYPAVGLWRV